ncbi:N-acetylhexosaminidase [Dentipellis sp. KUC8613]|nr:N-acetylhexosaminidase [Dentipellis sp. KUC8613]
MQPALALYLTLYLGSVIAIWPLPRTLQQGSTPLLLSHDFAFKVSFSHPPGDLLSAISRSSSFLQNDKLERLVVGRGAADRAAISGAKQISSLKLVLSGNRTVRSISEEILLPLEDRDESYILEIPTNGTGAALQANTTLGLFRGLTTFGQLWYYSDGALYTLEAPLHIEDSPVFPWRGLLLDTSRNFIPVDDIKRTFDAMSWVKLSTFHWHVVDSQSFPLQVPGFEELSQKGAYSADAVYTPGDVQELVSYAAERGIDVVVEVDTPGHTAIISESHPEFVACPQFTPWATFAEEPPAGQLRLLPDAANFTANLFSAVAKMFPSTMVSTGGDEVNAPCYEQDPEMQAYWNSTGQNLNQTLSMFMQATQQSLIKAGKTPVTKEEMALNDQLTIANNSLILVWKTSADLPRVIERGFRAIFAASDYMYLDCGAGEWLGGDVNGNSWCDPFKTWQKTYSADFLANLTDAQKSLVVGGQHQLWTEQTSAANLDPITWPRAASGAELFWSGPGGNVSAALPRLHDVAYRMIQRGVKAIPLQPQWCALRPGLCDLTS